MHLMYFTEQPMSAYFAQAGLDFGATALMFILLSHEFAASLLVRAPTVNVMGTILYDFYQNGGYPLVAAISLIMVGVTTAGVLVALALGGSETFKKL